MCRRPKMSRLVYKNKKMSSEMPTQVATRPQLTYKLLDESCFVFKFKNEFIEYQSIKFYLTPLRTEPFDWCMSVLKFWENLCNKIQYSSEEDYYYASKNPSYRITTEIYNDSTDNNVVIFEINNVVNNKINKIRLQF